MNVFEEYTNKVLKIPYCNFECVHPKVSYEVIAGLSLMYEMYPFFDKIICSIGDIQNLESHLNMLIFSEKNNVENLRTPRYLKMPKERATLYSLNYYTPHNLNSLSTLLSKNGKYFSINFTDNIKSLDNSKFKYLKTSIYGRYSIYHEFGHLLDAFLNISNNPKFLKLIENHDIEKEISKYACKNNKEIVAEAFAKYIMSQNKVSKFEMRTTKKNRKYKQTCSLLAKEIGKLIDEEYQKFIKYRQIKFINEKYKFNKKFTIVKNDITDKEKNKVEHKIKKLILK